MDVFSELIHASFTEEDVLRAERDAQYEIMGKYTDRFIDAALTCGFEPQVVIDVLRQSADDVAHAYEGVDE